MVFYSYLAATLAVVVWVLWLRHRASRKTEDGLPLSRELLWAVAVVAVLITGLLAAMSYGMTCIDWHPGCP